MVLLVGFRSGILWIERVYFFFAFSWKNLPCFLMDCFSFGFGIGEDSIRSRFSGSGDKDHAKGGGCWCLLQGVLLLAN